MGVISECFYNFFVVIIGLVVGWLLVFGNGWFCFRNLCGCFGCVGVEELGGGGGSSGGWV